MARATSVTIKKTGQTIPVKPKPYTGPRVNGFQVADSSEAGPRLPIQKAGASHPDMKPDGGLDTYGIPPRLV